MGGVWVAYTVDPKPRPRPLREESSTKEEEKKLLEKPLRRVRVGQEEEEPLFLLGKRLHQVVGDEPFHPEGGVNGLLRHWGFDPESVWQALSREGMLRRLGDMYQFLYPITRGPLRKPP